MHSEKTTRRIRTRRAVLSAAGMLFLLLAYREPFFTAKRPHETRESAGTSAAETLPASPESAELPLGSPDTSGVDEFISAVYEANSPSAFESAVDAVASHSVTAPFNVPAVPEFVESLIQTSGGSAMPIGTATQSTAVPADYPDLPEWAEAVAVINVSDGDTLHVRLRDRSEHYVRLTQCNTPESGAAERVGYSASTEAGYMASDFTKDLVHPGDTVFISKNNPPAGVAVTDLDRYGRMVRLVWLEEPLLEDRTDMKAVTEKTLNAKLLSSGMAEYVVYSGQVSGYEDLFSVLEEEAKVENRGLWKYDGAFEKQALDTAAQ